MNQIERIKQMERCLDQASVAVMELAAALEKYEAAKDSIQALKTYYGSDEWRKDFCIGWLNAGAIDGGYLDNQRMICIVND